MSSKINIDRLAVLLGELREARSKLENLAQKPDSEILADYIDNVKYNFIIAIQASIDVCYHIVSKSEGYTPQDYGDCFVRLAEMGIIQPDYARSLKKMAGFRNLLVHVYDKVDNNRVCHVLKNTLGDLQQYENQIEGFINKL